MSPVNVPWGSGRVGDSTPIGAVESSGPPACPRRPVRAIWGIPNASVHEAAGDRVPGARRGRVRGHVDQRVEPVAGPRHPRRAHAHRQGPADRRLRQRPHRLRRRHVQDRRLRPGHRHLRVRHRDARTTCSAAATRSCPTVACSWWAAPRSSRTRARARSGTARSAPRSSIPSPRPTRPAPTWRSAAGTRACSRRPTASSSPLAGYDENGNHSNTFQVFDPVDVHVRPEHADRELGRRRVLAALPDLPPARRRQGLLLRRPRVG